MGKEIALFGDTEIEKKKNYCHKTPIFLKKDVDIEKILVSNNTFFDDKKLKILYWLLV